MPDFSSPRAIGFGPFEVNRAAGELRKHGVRIKLSGQPFEVLMLLLEQPGEVVGHAELQAKLWPGDTFVDFEHGLHAAVNKLRSALGDSAENPRYVETLPRRGYRFVASVRVVNGDAQPQNPAVALAEITAPQAGDVTKGKPRWRLVFALLSIVVFALAVISLKWISRPSESKILQSVQITTSGKAEPWGGIHIDGSRLYFSERQGGRWPLMQTSVVGGEEQPAFVPFPNTNTRIFDLSPDGSNFLIGSFTDLSGNMPLWTMPAQGGAQRRVGDIIVDDASWFPDGKRILCAKGHEVFSVELDGRNPSHLFDVDGQAVDFSWRPDGSVVRFTVTDIKGNLTLWEAGAGGQSAHPLLPGWNNPSAECCGSWTPDGKNYVFSSIQNSREDVWVLHETKGLSFFSTKNSTKEPMRLTSGPVDFSLPIPSKDGKRLFVFGLRYSSTLLRFDWKQREFVPFLTSNPVGDLAFSRDRQWVAYIGGRGDLWRSKIDGSERLQLTSFPFQALRPRWSPDGKRLLFVGHLPGNLPKAYVVSADGGAPVAVLEGQRFCGYADWLRPNGESVAIDSIPELGSEAGISVVHLKTHQVSELPGSQGMIYVQWSPDGHYLAALSKDLKGLYLFDERLQRWTRAITADRINRYEWGGDSREIYFQKILDPGGPVFRLNVATGKIERSFDCNKPLQAGAIRCGFEGLAPDGSYLASIRTSVANIYALDVDIH